MTNSKARRIRVCACFEGRRASIRRDGAAPPERTVHCNSCKAAKIAWRSLGSRMPCETSDRMPSLSPAAAIASAWAWVKVPSATRDRIKARASSGVRFGAVPGCGSGSGSGSGCGTGSLSGFAFFSLADPLSGLAVFSSLAFFSGSGSGSSVPWVHQAWTGGRFSRGRHRGRFHGGSGAEATMSSSASRSLRWTSRRAATTARDARVEDALQDE